MPSLAPARPVVDPRKDHELRFASGATEPRPRGATTIYPLASERPVTGLSPRNSFSSSPQPWKTTTMGERIFGL